MKLLVATEDLPSRTNGCPNGLTSFPSFIKSYFRTFRLAPPRLGALNALGNPCDSCRLLASEVDVGTKGTQM